MKQLVIIIILSFVYSLSAFTQISQQLDSLKQLIPQKKDTALVHLYEKIERLYFQYRMSNDSIDKYFNLSMKLAKSIDYEEVVDEFSYRQALLSYRKGNYEKAVESIKKYIEEREKAKDFKRTIKGKSTLGSFYNKQAKYEEAVAIFLDCIEQSDSFGDKKELYLIYNRLADIMESTSDFEKAAIYYRDAQNHLQYIPADYLPTSEVTLMYNMATNFYNMNELDSANYYINLVLEKSQKIDYQEGKNLGLFMQMYIASKKEDYPLTLESANQLLASYEEKEINDMEWYLDIFRNKIIALTHLKRYEEAIGVSQKMEDLAADCELLICREKVIGVKYFIHRERGNFEQALTFAEQHFEVRDSIINEEKEKNIQRLQKRYETAQKEKSITELNQKNQEQSFSLQKRNYLIAGVSFASLLLLLSLYWFSQQKIAKESQQKIEAEQRLLRVQMNPHFIFNALANIQSFFLEEKDNNKGVQYLSQFATLMRQVLEHSREQYISVEEEIQTLENYLVLQRARHQNRFDYQIEVEETIEVWETLIPPLMTQPFVENAIQHSQIQQLENGYIKVLIKKEKDNIIVIIEDNGVGRKNTLKLNSENPHKSLSSTITKERIELLSKITKRSFNFKIKDLTPQGTQVVLTFPVGLG